MKKKNKAIIAEIIIAIGVLFTINFSDLKPIDYAILLFMVTTLLFTFLNWRNDHAQD